MHKSLEENICNKIWNIDIEYFHSNRQHKELLPCCVFHHDKM